MKTLFTNKKVSEKGFSLIELMIVVAIIGILAAIAVPTFTNFQKKARTSEGKTVLGAIYSSMTAYKAESGNIGSSAVLTDTGYTLVPLQSYTAIGFTGTNQANLKAGSAGSVTSGNVTCGSVSAIDNTSWIAGADPDGDAGSEVCMTHQRAISEAN